MYLFNLLVLLNHFILLSNIQEEQYSLVDYNYILNLVEKINKNQIYQSFIKTEELIQKYDIQNELFCDKEKKNACKNYSITLTNFKSPQSEIIKRPQILILGGKHGNEVTGTNAIIWLIELFMKFYFINQDLNSILDLVWIIFVPTINIQGFSLQQWEEIVQGKLIDPNRDFPFNRKDNTCFLTVTSQIINQLYQENTIIGTLTLHGGENSITYPWGCYSHQEDFKSDDENAFNQVALFLQWTAGENKDLQIKQYKIGNMHKVVYDVHGGFEDWAYGGSWDQQNVTQFCQRKESINKYQEASLRSLVFLIEAGYDKIPKEKTLGNELYFFEQYNQKSILGHISRNMFMIYKFAQLFQPQVKILNISFDEKNDKTNMEVQVIGCFKVSDMWVNNKPIYVKETQTENIKIKIKLQLIGQASNLFDVFEIQVQCDQQFDEYLKYPRPQTHYMKLKIDKNYQIQNENNDIKSQQKMTFQFLNINVNRFDEMQCFQVQLYQQKCEFGWVIFVAFDNQQIIIKYQNEWIKIISEKEEKLDIYYNLNNSIANLNDKVNILSYQYFKQIQEDQLFIISNAQNVKGKKLQLQFQIAINQDQIFLITNCKYKFIVELTNIQQTISNFGQVTNLLNNWVQIQLVQLNQQQLKKFLENQSFIVYLLDDIKNPIYIQQQQNQQQKSEKTKKVKKSLYKDLEIYILFILVLTIASLYLLYQVKKQTRKPLIYKNILIKDAI